MESYENKGLTTGDAFAQILIIMRNVMTMGANDYEPSAFTEILEGLEEGKISPEEALRQAKAIEQGKLDYH